MLTFLFWNMGGDLPETTKTEDVVDRYNRLSDILRNLTRSHAVDLLMLAECPLSQETVLEGINLGKKRSFRPPDSRTLCQRINLYPRFPASYISRTDESSYFTGRQVSIPGRDSFLLYVVHLSSKTNQGEESQSQEMPGFIAAIRKREVKAKHSRTIVVGDFNQNPFETGIVSAQGMNAAMTRDVVKQESRTVHGDDYPFFYNPMWSHFGDSTHELKPPGSPDHEPAGSCYYSAGESKWFYWQMLDQVMLRSALIDRFRNADLRILVTDGVRSFLNANGRPDRSKVSDHLPLLFRVDL